MRKIGTNVMLILAVAMVVFVAASARAATITYFTTTPVPSTLTDWTGSLPFLQFDPSLGTLTSVELVLNSSMNTTITITNLATSSSTGSVGTELFLTVTYGSLINEQMYEEFPDPRVSFSLNPGQTKILGPYTANGAIDATYTDSAVLAAFTGTGVITLNASTATFTVLSYTGGVMNASQVTLADLNGYVIYNYDPVPEPSVLLLFGSGLIGLGAFARRKFKK